MGPPVGRVGFQGNDEMPERGVTIPREEVARYLLAVEAGKRASYSEERARLQGLRSVHIWEEFHRVFGNTSNRAALKLLEGSRYTWWSRDWPLGALTLRAFGRRLAVSEVATMYRATPEDERSLELRRYAPRAVPTGRATLVVHEEDGSERVWLGDGYHRGVSLYLQGVRTAHTYFGDLSSTRA